MRSNGKFYVRNLGGCYELTTRKGNNLPFIFLEDNINPFLDNESLLEEQSSQLEEQLYTIEPSLKEILEKKDMPFLLEAFRYVRREKEYSRTDESYFDP